jgi:hypothetical protein
MNDLTDANLASELRSLRSSNPTYAALFDWLQSRQRGAYVTKARVASERIDREYMEVISVFKKLQELGVGQFIVGRKGQESRFEWEYDVKSIALMALGELDAPELKAIDAPINEDDDGIKHSFTLRPNLSISIHLPSDLRGREADRLASWIKTLPFDDE